MALGEAAVPVRPGTARGGIMRWGATVIVAAFTAAVCHAAGVPYTTDFESATGPEWSSSLRDATVPDPFTSFSGRFGNETQALSLAGLSSGGQYSVFFDLCIIDDWPGGSDRILVDVDGSNHFSHSFHQDGVTQSYPLPPDVGPDKYGFYYYYKESIYRRVEAAFTAASSNATVSFSGENLQSMTYQSWGIDNVLVDLTTNLPTSFFEANLPDDGTTNAVVIDRVSLRATRSLDAATATNAANYELREDGADGVMGNGDDFVHTLTPSLDSPRHVLIGANNVPLQPGTYRFRTTSGLQDTNGQAVAVLDRTFTVEHPPAGKIEGLGNGDRTSADPLPWTESPAGSGFYSPLGMGSVFPLADHDYWRFEAEAGDRVSARVEFDGDVDPHVQLQNASGGWVAEGFNYNWNWYARFEDQEITTPGTYYLVVFTHNDDDTGHYRLRLDVARGRALETEDNYDQSHADTLSLVVDGSALKAPAAGALVDGDQDDYFEIGHFAAGSPLSINLRFPLGSELNAGNVQIGVEREGTGEVLSTNAALASYDTQAAGIHYLRVSAPGVEDLRAQYVLDLTAIDSEPPRITGTTLPPEGSTNTYIVSGFDLTFSEWMDGPTVSASSNYAMTSAGSDGVFGNGDDESYTLAVDYDDELTASLSLTDGPLQPGRRYRFDAGTGLVDRVGNAMTGVFARVFAIAGVAGYITEGRDNETQGAATSLDPLAEDPAGAGLRFAVGRGALADGDDDDWWSFTVVSGQVISVAADMVGEINNARVYFGLHRPNGTMIDTLLTDSGGYGTLDPVTASVSGTYAVRAFDSPYGSHWGEYRLRVSTATPALGFETEQNNATGEADSLAFVTTNGLQAGDIAGYIDRGDDEGDFFSLGNVSSGTIVELTLRLPSSSGLVPRMELLSPAGTPVPLTTNRVLDMDGTDDCMLVSEYADFPTNEITAEFWMKTDDTSKSGTPFSYAVAARDDEFAVINYQSFSTYVRDDSRSLAVSANDGEWRHIAVTWKSLTGACTFYKDGEPVKTNAFQVGNFMETNGTLVVGQDQDSLGGGFQSFQGFVGVIDEIRLWNTVRTAEEIQSTLYTNFSGAEPGLVGYWTFDDGTAGDGSAAGYDGTLQADAQVIIVDPPVDPDSPSANPTSLTFTVISDGVHYVRLRDGFDSGGLMSQYILDVTLEELTPPEILAIGLPAEGATATSVIDRFTMTFSEEMSSNTVVEAGNYELRGAGADTVLDTPDDDLYSLVIAYTEGLTASLLVTDGPLQPGPQRFTVAALQDRGGTPMAVPAVRSFALAEMSGFVLEGLDNGSPATATTLSSAPTNRPDRSFLEMPEISADLASPVDLVLIDLNADTNLDLVVVDEWHDRVTVFSGNGDGTFAAATNVPVGDSPSAVVAGLFNADAHLDLAVVNNGPDTISLLAGDGNLGFAAGSPISVDQNPRDIAAGDLNGDGSLDLVTANSFYSTISVLIGQGDGTFSGRTEYATGNGAYSSPYAVLMAELTGDGTTDVAVANQSHDNVSLFEGNGDGTFDPRVNFDVPEEPKGIVAGLLTGDGNVDLAVADSYSASVTILGGDGSGTFTSNQTLAVGSGPRSIVVEDLDADGIVDLAVANFYGDSFSILYGEGGGTFAAHRETAAENGTVALDSGDLNGDTIPDLVLANQYDGSLTILLGNPTEPLAADTVNANLFRAEGYGNLTDRDDVDYWSFSAEAGDLVTVAVEVPGQPSQSRMVITIYGPTGQQVEYFYASYQGYGQSPLITVADSGRHTVSVAFYSDDYNGEYRLAVTVARPPLQMESEPNDDTGAADDLTLTLTNGEHRASVAGYIGVGDTDGDFFSLGTLASGTVINVTVTNPADSALKSHLQVLDSDGDFVMLGTNGVLWLAGGSDYADLGTWAPSNRWTVAARVQPWALPAGRRSVAGCVGTGQDWGLAMQDGMLGGVIRPPGGVSSVVEGDAAAKWQWDHVAAACDGTNVRVYVNGALENTAAVEENYTASSAGTRIGSTAFGGEYFEGAIDTVAVWDRPLNGTEIQAHMNAGLSGSEPGLMGCWDFDDGTAADGSTNGIDGTLVNDAWIGDPQDPSDPAGYATTIAYTTRVSGTFYVLISEVPDSATAGLLSRYILDISTIDTVAPFVTGTTLPAAGSTSTSLLDRFTVSFSEELDGDSTREAGHYALVAAGIDGTPGTVDDDAYALEISYSGGLSASYTILDGPLQADDYRFTASSNITDRNGLALIPYTNAFSVADFGDYLMESRSNETAGAGTPLHAFSSDEADGTFEELAQALIGGSPRAMAGGLFNQDTNLDLAVATGTGDKVAVLAGGGDATFTFATNYSVGQYAVAVIAGDWNGDTNADLAVANYSSETVSIRLGQGDGMFTAAADLSLGARPSGLASCDLDNDGHADLLAAKEDTDALGVWLGNGNGTFSEQADVSTGSEPAAVAAADLDGDGTNDAVVADYADGTVSLLFGTGDGGFAAATNYGVAAGPCSVLATDLNWDGKADIAVACEGADKVAVLVGLGGGAFAPAALYAAGDGACRVIAVDLNGDLALDLVTANQVGDSVSVLLGDGYGTFALPADTGVGDAPVDLVAGDFDHDTDVELAVLCKGDGSVRVLEPNATATLPEDLAGAGLRSRFCRGMVSGVDDEDHWTFYGQAGHLLSVAVDVPGNPNDSSLLYEVTEPDGDELASLISDFHGYGELAPTVLPVSGRYTLRVSRYDSYYDEYRVRVTTVAPPIGVETEDNDTRNEADVPGYAAGVGERSALMLGYAATYDTDGDYYALGSLDTATDVDLHLRLPASSGLSAALHVFDVSGAETASAGPGATNLSFTAVSNQAYYARVSGTAATRGLDALYLLGLDLADATPPSVRTVSLPAHGVTNSEVLTAFTITFSEEMAAAGVTNPASHDLRAAGADAAFGTGDDELYALSPEPYSGGVDVTFNLSDGPLQPEAYRFTIDESVTDAMGNPLPEDYVLLFHCRNAAGFTVEDRDNGTAALATPLTVIEDPAGLRTGAGKGRIVAANDEDCFAFAAVSNEWLVFGVDVPANPNGSRLRYRVENAGGAGILAADLVPAVNGRGQAATVAVPSNATYYVRVARDAVSGDEYRGEYHARVSLVSDPLQAENEANDAIGTADTMPLAASGSTNSGSFAGCAASPGDLDYVGIGTVTNGLSVLLGVRLPTNSLLVPVVSLYNAANQYQEEQGISGDGVAEVVVTADDTYYAVVRSGENTGGLLDQYVLDVETLPTGTLSVPNLRVADIAPPSGSGLLSGTTVGASYVVTNAGTAATGSDIWSDRVVLSRNKVMGDADDLFVLLHNRSGALTAGGAYTNDINFLLPDGISGPYYLMVYTDVGDLVDESVFNADNVRASDNTFAVALNDYPDLVVENFTLSTSNEVGGALTIAWDTANRGSTNTAATFYEELVITRKDTGAELHRQEIAVGAPLAVDGSVPHQVDFTTSREVVHRVQITTDSRSQVFEFDAISHASAEQNTVVGFADVTQFHDVHVEANPPEGGSVSGGGHYPAGAIVTVSTTPSTELPYSFGSWRQWGHVRSLSRTYTFLLQGDQWLSADYTLPNYEVGISREPASGGTVWGSGIYPHGSTVEFRAYTNPGYRFDRWLQGSNVVQTAAQWSAVITNNLDLAAVYGEINPYHDVTTATSPTGVTVVAGAGYYTNGESTVFSAAAVVTNGDYRYTFEDFLLNGSRFALTNWVAHTFTPVDSTNMDVVAEYGVLPVTPRIVSIGDNYGGFVPATTNYRLSVVFDRAMDTAIEPLLVFTNGEAGLSVTAPTNGSWRWWRHLYDAYDVPAMTFTQGMDGAYTILVSRATDPWGAELPKTNALVIDVDATAPTNPAISAIAYDLQGATVAWDGYAAPPDLSRFSVYVQTSSFTNVTGLSQWRHEGASSRSTRLVWGIEKDTQYYVGVMARDLAGNADRAVTSTPFKVESVVPPPVDPILYALDYDDMDLRWHSYDTSELIGLEGFRVYWEAALFTSVTGLTPVATLSAGGRSLRFDDLDRTREHYFAVVAFNRLDQAVTDVVAKKWADPYAGEITADLTIGDGPDREIPIFSTMAVTNGAELTIERGTTLRFAPGTRLDVVDGSLVAHGTALEPVVFTSLSDTNGGVPGRGDWDGVRLGPGAGESELEHVWTFYGRGLTIDGCSPDLVAYSAEQNAGAGLALAGNADLTTSEALSRFNALGLDLRDTARLELAHSIVLNNDTNVLAGPAASCVASQNWWGVTTPSAIEATFEGTVVYDPPLAIEPLLTPAAALDTGYSYSPVRDINLRLACRVAESLRISENSAYPGVFFEDFVADLPFQLSETEGVKTLYIQFRNVTGQTNAPLELPVNYSTGGPRITSFSLNENETLTRPTTVTGTADAYFAVDRMGFILDGHTNLTVSGDTFSYRWDVRDVTGGIRRVQLAAWDSNDKLATLAHNVIVRHEPPPAPVITDPADTVVLPSNSVDVAGTAEPYIDIRLRRGALVFALTQADASGHFAIDDVQLIEGDNDLVAVAYDQIGETPSAVRTVVLDTFAPPPVELELEGYGPESGVELTWSYAPQGERARRFRLYWDEEPFATTNEAAHQSGLLDAMNHVLFPEPDGHYHFSVVGIDEAGNVSDLSNLVESDVDTTPPVLTVGYDRSSPLGVGPLRVIIESSEGLSGVPDVMVRPQGARGPIMLSMASTDPNVFEGSLQITAATPSGEADVRASASDVYGNAFSGSPTGAVLVIDTTAPTAAIQTSPATLVQTKEPVDLAVSFVLDEPHAPDSVPSLWMKPPVGLKRTIPLTGAGTEWRGTVQLVPLMGNGDCRFTMEAVDGLGNVGNLIREGDRIEIYNTDLPSPPATPVLDHASTRTGGVVRVVWYPSLKAETYSLYREPGTSGVPVTVALDGLTTNAVSDLPPADGSYRYGVVASRRGADSPLSNVLTGYSDRTPPPPPTNVVVTLGAGGVLVTWDEPPAGERPFQYHVYRDGTRVGSAYVPQPVTDYPPKGTSTYTVASADLIGNESVSDPVELEMLVAAVASFDVLVLENAAPQLSWTSTDPEIVGVNLYRGGIRLNTQLLARTSVYVDNDYSGAGFVEYSVAAENGVGQESPARIAPVYRLRYGLAPNTGGQGLPLMHYFDAYTLPVTNLSVTGACAIASVELRRTTDDEAPVETLSAVDTNIAPGQVAETEAVLPCIDAVAEQTVRATLNQALLDPQTTVHYRKSWSFNVVSVSAQQVGVSVTNPPLAGLTCNVQARIHNRGHVPMELVLSSSDGSEPGDLYVSVRTELDEEVSRVEWIGSVPGMIVTDDGRAYTTVDPGEFLDVTIEDVLIPEALGGNEAVIEAGAARIYHAIGTDGELESGPVRGQMQTHLQQTPYYGTCSADKSSYVDDETVHLSGHALDRATGTPVSNVTLRLSFALYGATWYEDVVTGADGAYAHELTIPPGLSGILSIWAAHPDVVDRLDQEEIEVYRLFVVPDRGQIRMSKNDSIDIDVRLMNPAHAPATGWSDSFRAYVMDGTNQVDIDSMDVTVLWPDGFAVNPGARRRVMIRLQADVDAPDFVLVSVTMESSTGASATFEGEVTLSEAVPVLSVADPAVGYVEAGVNRGELVNRRVTIVNRGVRELFAAEMLAPTNVTWMVPTVPLSADGRRPLGDIPIGGSNTFDIVFAPPEGTPMGVHQDVITITGTNHPQPFVVNLYATVTSALEGDVQFVIRNSLGLAVPNARIRMRNQLINEQRLDIRSDAEGQALVTGLQEGTWEWRAEASGHTAAGGVIDVVPDQVVEVFSRLRKSLVSIRFTVEPVPFTDRYEITIEQEFETHVPAGVLVLSPRQKDFDNVRPGFDATYLVYAENQGLIALRDVTVRGSSNREAEMVPLIDYFPRLEPFQKVAIPIRLRYWGDDGTPLRQGGGFTDCMSGGVTDVLDALKVMDSLVGAEHDCIDSREADQNIRLAQGILVGYSVYSAASSVKGGKNLKGFLENALPAVASCLGQQIGAWLGLNDVGSNPRFWSQGGESWNLVSPKCFPAGTRVMLADGSALPIEQLVTGTVVRSGWTELDTARVAWVPSRVCSNLLEIAFDAASAAGGRTSDAEAALMRVTADHRIWIDGKGWTAARDVAAGDHGFNAREQRIRVRRVSPVAGPHTVYTLMLSGDRAFFAEDVLVHEGCGPPGPGEYRGVVSTQEGGPSDAR